MRRRRSGVSRLRRGYGEPRMSEVRCRRPDVGEPSFGNDAMGANRKGNDNVMINDEENAVLVSDIKVENLMSMPEDACEFVTTQRRQFAEKRANLARAAA
jgi:hypothetical protein